MQGQCYRSENSTQTSYKHVNGEAEDEVSYPEDKYIADNEVSQPPDNVHQRRRLSSARRCCERALKPLTRYAMHEVGDTVS